jgi:hypothetical protein
MSDKPLTYDEFRELTFLYIVTRDGSWSHRTPKRTPETLVTRGYAEHLIKDLYRITDAGIAALESKDAS